MLLEASQFLIQNLGRAASGEDGALRVWRAATVRRTGPFSPSGSHEYFSFTLNQGQSSTMVLTSLNGGSGEITLVDPDGNVLERGLVFLPFHGEWWVAAARLRAAEKQSTAAWQLWPGRPGRWQ